MLIFTIKLTLRQILVVIPSRYINFPSAIWKQTTSAQVFTAYQQLHWQVVRLLGDVYVNMTY
jgi:hypothetical protein